MATPPTLVAFAVVNGSVASGTNITTASLSWQTNDVVVAFTGTEGGTSGETQNTPTTTGSGISFGAAQRIHNSTGSDCGVGCWAAVASASSSGTFSFNGTYNNNRMILLGVYIFRGSAGIGNSNIYLGTTPAGCALTPTGADGSIAWIDMDWHTDAVQSFTPTPTTHGASSPGPSASPASAQLSPQFTYYIGELDDQTSAGQVYYGIGGTNTGPFSIIAIEAKAAEGGPAATATPQAIVVPNAAVIRAATW